MTDEEIANEIAQFTVDCTTMSQTTNTTQGKLSLDLCLVFFQKVVYYHVNYSYTVKEEQHKKQIDALNEKNSTEKTKISTSKIIRCM